jgi:hypothetical protein
MRNKKLQEKRKHQKITVPRKACGSVQKKILLLLLAGVALGLTRSPRKQFKIITSIPEEFKKLGPNTARAFSALYDSKLVKKIENEDGTTTVVLSERGRKQALTYSLQEMKLKKTDFWDSVWRLVLYDIPEVNKKGRDSLRQTLFQIGMFELQQSVFIYPFPCKEEIDFIVELYDLRRFVRYVEAISIDNENHIKSEFGLL